MRTTPSSFIKVALFVSLSLAARPAIAAEWYVSPGGTGPGSAAAPFGRIQDGINAAQPGDTVVVAPGTYPEALSTVRPGTAPAPITIRATIPRSAIVTIPGRVLTVGHSYITVDGLVLDGQFGADDIVRIGSAGSRFIMRNAEVRSTSRDAIDIGSPDDVLIENTLVHHALNAADGRTDAHGIVAGSARRLTIRNTEVHTFSGDAFQIDPGRSAPGWSDVLIEGCKFWLRPLPSPVNGFAAGVVPGENAIDTKVNATLSRGTLTVRNSEFFGFMGGLITNMAALNLKENVDAVIDGVTVHSSEIAFRVRAPANVRVQNAIVHSVAFGVRYEDNIQGVRVWNTTFGNGVGRVFLAASSPASVLDVRNVAVLGVVLPPEASDPSNMAVPSTAFVNAAGHDYEASASSPLVDRGVAIPQVPVDRRGTLRPQGSAYDIGAYERSKTRPTPPGNLRIIR